MWIQEVLHQNALVCKTLEDFGENGSGIWYCLRKIKAQISRNDVHVLGIQEKSYVCYVPNNKSRHKMCSTKL